MPALRIDFSEIQQLDSNSEVLNGCKLYVYESETTTLKTLYSDRDGLVTAANPIEADSAGRLPTRYVANDDLMTLALKTSAGVSVWSVDDFEPVASVDNTALSDYVARAGGNDNRMTGPLEFKEGAAVASATSIDLDAATGNFLHITGTTTIATITLAQGSMRWVVFDGALTLTHSSNLILPANSTNIVTVAGDCALLVGEGGGVTRCLDYRLISGKPLLESAEFEVKVGDESTALTTGTAKITWRQPFAMTLDALPLAFLTTASSGAAPAIDINENGVSIFSTTLTIDASETTSATAATAAVLSDTSLAFNSVMTIDIDTAGTNAAGLGVILRGYRHNRT